MLRSLGLVHSHGQSSACTTTKRGRVWGSTICLSVKTCKLRSFFRRRATDIFPRKEWKGSSQSQHSLPPFQQFLFDHHKSGHWEWNAENGEHLNNGSVNGQCDGLETSRRKEAELCEAHRRNGWSAGSGTSPKMPADTGTSRNARDSQINACPRPFIAEGLMTSKNTHPTVS